MNKKLLGLTALMALVLAGCGGGSSSESSSTPDSSADSSSTTETTSESSSTETRPDVSVVSDAFAAIGTTFEATVTKGEEVITTVHGNEDYVFAEGLGGIALITPVEEEVTPVANPEGAPVLNKRGLNVNPLRAAALEDEGTSDAGEEEVVEENKYFLITEEDGKFSAQWGAYYNSREEFLEKLAVANFADVVADAFAAETIYWSKANKMYECDDASLIYSVLSSFALESVAPARVGFDVENGLNIVLFDSILAESPFATIAVENVEDSSYAALEAYLATFTAYPTSPLSIREVGAKIQANNYLAKGGISIFGSSYDLAIDTYADATGYTNLYTGEFWSSWYKNFAQYGAGTGMANGYVDVAAADKEIADGYYKFGSPAKGEISVSAAEKQSKNYDAGYFNYLEFVDSYEEGNSYADVFYTLADFVPYMAKYGVEKEGAFYISDGMDQSLAGITDYMLQGYILGDEMFDFCLSALEDGYVENEDGTISLHVLRPYEMYMEYDAEEVTVDDVTSLDVTEINLYIGFADWYGVFDETKGYTSSGFDLSEGLWYEQVKISGFGTTVNAKTNTFLDGLQDVVFAEDLEESIVLEPEGTHTWNVLSSYTPTTAKASLMTLSDAFGEENTVASIDETGLVTAIDAGEETVAAVIGGAVAMASVTVKGLKVTDDEGYVNKVKVSPDSSIELGLEFYGLDLEGAEFNVAADAGAEVASGAVAFREVEEEAAEGETPVVNKVYYLTVNGLALGEAKLTVSVTTSDGKFYTRDLLVAVAPEVVFDDEEVFFKAAGGDLALKVSAPAGTAVNVASSNEEVATVSYDSETGLVTVTGVAEGLVTVTASITVNDVEYKDEVVVNLSNLTYLGIWDFTDPQSWEDGTIALRSDKSVTIEVAGEVVAQGTFVDNEGAAVVTIDGFGERNFTLTGVEGGNYDGVAVMLYYTMTATDESGEVTEYNAIAYRNGVEILPYRTYQYGTVEGLGKVEVYIFNNFTYAVLVDGSVVVYQALSSTVLYEVISEDGLSRTWIYYNTSYYSVFAFYFTRETTDSNWVQDTENYVQFDEGYLY